MAKGIVKETKKRYKNSRIKRVLKTIGGTFLGITLSALIATSIYSLCLPRLNSKEEANNFLVSNGYNADYDNINTILKNTYTATTPPILSDTIKLNIAIDDLSGEQIADMQAVVEEFNFIFSIINPKYKFKLNFDPTVADYLNPGNITVKGYTDLGLLLFESKLGNVHWTLPYFNKTGVSSMYQIINLKYQHEKCNMRDVFAHELLHCLGVGDAYILDEDIDVPSIMNHSAFLRKNDIALLVSKYGDYSTPEKEASLKIFIENYEQNTPQGQKIMGQQETLYKEFIQHIEKHPELANKNISFEIPEKLYIINPGFGVNYLLCDMSEIDNDKYVDSYYDISQTTGEFRSHLNAYEIEKTSLNTSYYVDHDGQQSYLLYICDGDLYQVVKPENGNFYRSNLGTIVDKETFDEYTERLERYKALDKDEALASYQDFLTQTIIESAKNNGLTPNKPEHFIGQKFVDSYGNNYTFNKDSIVSDSAIFNNLPTLYHDYGISVGGYFFHLNDNGSIDVYNVDYLKKSLTQVFTLEKQYENELG